MRASRIPSFIKAAGQELFVKYIASETIELPDGGRIAVVYLDNPDSRNSMTLEMGLSFHGELHRIAGVEPLPRAVVITGRNGVFSSGGDFELLRSFAENSPGENRDFMGSFYRLFLEVRNMPFPVIAAVNGHAIGAALALALACDLRYFTPQGKYALNFVRLGFHPGMGSSFLIREVAGLHQAQELLLTGRTITGDEAYRRGLCHGLFEPERILEGALGVAREVAAAAPQAVRLTKKGIYRTKSLEEALSYEAESQAANFSTADFRESLTALSEKRAPVFRDQ